jgi:hypothetical protein
LGDAVNAAVTVEQKNGKQSVALTGYVNEGGGTPNHEFLDRKK